MAPSLRPEDIENVHFTVVRLSEAGYRQQEVDDFLDTVHSAYVQMWADNASLQNGPATVQLPKAIAAEVAKVDDEPPAPVKQPEPNGPSLATIGLLLTQAEATAAKLVADAKAEAEVIKGQVVSDANVIKGQAIQDADALKATAKADAESLRQAVAAEVEQLRTDAHAGIDRLLAEAKDERAKVVAALEADKVKLLGHVGELSSAKESLLSALKEVVAKVEGK